MNPGPIRKSPATRITRRAPPPRRRARWPYLLAGAAFLYLCLMALPLTGILRAPAENIAMNVLGRAVSMKSLRINLFSAYPWVKIKELHIANAAWAKQAQLADIKRLKVSLSLPDLARGRLVIQRLEVDDGTVDLLRQANGRANWLSAESGPAKPLALPTVRELIINNAHISYVDEPRNLQLDAQLNSQETSSRSNQPFLLKGVGNLNGRSMNIQITGGSVLNGLKNQPYPFTARVNHGDTLITAEGAFARLFDFSNFTARTEVSGSNMANLYYLTGLAFPLTKPYKLSGEFHRQDTTYEFKDFKGRVGESDLNGTITVEAAPGSKPYLSANLTSKLLDPTDAGVLFGTPDPDHVFPNVPLATERLRSMNAEVSYKAQAINVSTLPLKEVNLALKLKDANLIVDPLELTLPQGRVKGTLLVNATGDVPDVTIDVTLSGAQLQDFMAKAAPGQQAALEGPLLGRVKLHGTGQSVHAAMGNSNGAVTLVIPNGQIRQAFAELMGINVARGLGLLLSGNQQTIPLRCGILSFDAKDGTLHSNRLVFDTGTILAQGSGTVNLDAESLNLALRGKPKEPRLLRLMLPIHIGGTLRHPQINPQLVGASTQLGTAAALGVVLTPLAAILPFVDAGLADNANCTALLQEAKSDGTPLTPSQVTGNGKR